MTRIDGESGEGNSPDGITASSDRLCVVQKDKEVHLGERREVEAFNPLDSLRGTRKTLPLPIEVTQSNLFKDYSRDFVESRCIAIRFIGNKRDCCCHLESEKRDLMSQK